MTEARQVNTAELGEVRLRLRDDLEFTLQEYAGEVCYVVEDRVASRFYRIGLPEYTLISLLDGDTTLGQAISHAARVIGRDAFSEQEAAAIAKWLTDCDLAISDVSLDVERLGSATQRVQQQQAARWLNPIVVKVPLGNPTRFVEQATNLFGWMATTPAVVACCLLWAVAAMQLFAHWDELTSSTNLVLARDNWLWLTATLVGLKLIHETAHAVACRWLGGHVREAGIVFILFAPIPYVDVTSSWRFPSKWHRIAVAAAGMYAELVVAAIAMLVWSISDNGLVRHHAYNTLLLASVTTLVFNANFLMRFDGYYIFADLLEIPNLYSLGQQYLSYLSRRYLMGVSASPPQWPFWKAVVVRLYGVAAFAWRLVVCGTLLYAASMMWDGSGVVLAGIAIVLWCGVPIVRLIKYLFRDSGRDRPRLVRLAASGTLLTAVVIATLAVVPYPNGDVAPAVVRYRSPMTVRTATAGFVNKVHVSVQSEVLAGDILLTLSNQQLELECAELRISLQQSALRARNLHARGEIAAYQAEEKIRESLADKLAQRERELAGLIVCAPTSGCVLADSLESLPDRYLPVGFEVLKIVNSSEKEILVSIPQAEVDRFRPHLAHTMKFLPTGSTKPFDVTLEKLSPRATLEVSDLRLAATSGGPVPVRNATTRGQDSSPTFQFLLPHFEASASPTSTAIYDTRFQDIAAGQTGYLRLPGPRSSLGAELLLATCRILRQHLPGPAAQPQL